MPEGSVAQSQPEVNRKRSRSPSDTEQPKLKRANTGLANSTSNGTSANASASASSRSQSAHDSSRLDDSAASAPTASLKGQDQRDVNMNDFGNDGSDAPPDDTAASTPTAAEHKEDTPGATAQSGDTPSGSSNMSGTVAVAPTSSSNGPPAPAPSATIHMRCLIVTQDASIIIGRGGKHVNEIREKSGARVVVSESIPGNPERILNVSGPLDAVSKVRLRHTMFREGCD